MNETNEQELNKENQIINPNAQSVSITSTKRHSATIENQISSITALTTTITSSDISYSTTTNVATSLTSSEFNNNETSATNHWRRAADVLRSNPSLMKREILFMTLKNKPPLHIVEFMIHLNPNTLVHISEAGKEQEPSALLTAVKHDASIEVIEAIIRANPYALCSSRNVNINETNILDPLTYAKTSRKSERDLIELLELPVSYWLDPVQLAMPPSIIQHSQQKKQHRQPPGGFSFQPQHHQQHLKSCNSNYYKLSKSEREELDNIKVITTSILRSQRRQLDTDAQDRASITTRLEELEIHEKRARQDQLAIFKHRERSMIKTHFVALDMKERALRQKLVAVGSNIKGTMSSIAAQHAETLQVNEQAQEDRHKVLEESLASLCKEISDAANQIQHLSDNTEAKLNSISTRVDREASLNSRFRERTVMKQLQLEQRFDTVINDQQRTSLFVDKIDDVEDFFSEKQSKQSDLMLKDSIIRIGQASRKSILDENDHENNINKEENDSIPLVNENSSRVKRCFLFFSFNRAIHRKRRRWQCKEDSSGKSKKFSNYYRPLKRRKKSTTATSMAYSKMKCMCDTSKT